MILWDKQGRPKSETSDLTCPPEKRSFGQMGVYRAGYFTGDSRVLGENSALGHCHCDRGCGTGASSHFRVSENKGDSECQDLLIPYPSPLIYLFLSYSILSPPVLPSSVSCLLPTPLICYVDVFKILSVSFS